MTQRDALERALVLFGTADPDDPVAVALVGVLDATLTIKKWEQEDPASVECECEQCVAAVSLAHALIEDLTTDHTQEETAS